MAEKVTCTMVMYHYVRNMHETNYPDIKGCLISKFIGQLRYICKHYSIIRLEDYVDFILGRKDIPDNSCVLTFDDGLRDHYTNVFPILKNMNIPASFFPITQPLTEWEVPPVHETHFLLAKIGPDRFAEEFNRLLKKRFPELTEAYWVDPKVKKNPSYRWDGPLVANLKWIIATMPLAPKVELLREIFSRYFQDKKEFCKELYLSGNEMREMMREGMSFGGHSHSHPALPALTQEEQMKEIMLSKEILERQLNAELTLFAYPYGAFSDVTQDLLKKAGYVCALSTVTGINEGRDENLFSLKRLDVNDLPFEA